MAEAFITPALVRWARERSDFTADTLAEKVSVSESKIRAWEDGGARPTFRQAQALASKLHVPFGFLFLSTPPTERIPLPDLRTLAGSNLGPPSPNFVDILNDALRKQEWYREYRQTEGAESLPFSGRFSLSDSPEIIAADIVTTLGIDASMRQQAQNWEEFLRQLVQRAEAAGVIVLRNGVVGNNTHRKLSVAEFRGFAISDDLAPLIFVNGQDAKTAQIFTTAHELAHLWVGESGISNPDYVRRPSEQANPIDRLCDQVAAETLVPRTDFLLRWRESESLPINLQRLAIHYRVSRFVVLRRAYDSNKVSFDEYRESYDELVSNLTLGRGQGGGDFYRTLLIRNSGTLTRTLLAAASEGRTPELEAARLLNVKVRTLQDLRDRLSTGAMPGA